VFEHFTEQARQAVVVPQEEARELRHSHIGSEHLFLGLLDDEEDLAARALASFDATLEAARTETARRVAAGDGPQSSNEVAGQLTFFRKLVAQFKTPQTKVWEFQ
jgi:ATP-dependent Clp protease ATP-binding subunit ClpC